MESKICNWMLDKNDSTFNVKNEDVSLETLRGRNPPSPARRKDSPGLVPPQRKDTPREAAEAAATSAFDGYVRALEEEDPKMVAARVAQAIAVAASTSRTNAGFVAAATAVESAALLNVENSRIRAPYGQLKALTKHAINAAVDAALAADDDSTSTSPPPLNTRDTHTLEQRKLPLVPELPPDPPTQEPKWQLWMDFMKAEVLLFSGGYLIAFAFGLGLERALLSGTVMAVYFGILLIRGFP